MSWTLTTQTPPISGQTYKTHVQRPADFVPDKSPLVADVIDPDNYHLPYKRQTGAPAATDIWDTTIVFTGIGPPRVVEIAAITANNPPWGKDKPPVLDGS